MVSARDSLPPKAVRYLGVERLGPKVPEGFKPFWFRKTKFDTFKRYQPTPTGSGKYAYFKVTRQGIKVLRTNNFYQALALNFRALDLTPPKESHYEGMNTLEFIKWKLLRSLENFIHLLTKNLGTKTKYFTQLSCKVRYWLRDYSFGSVIKCFKHLHGKVTKRTPMYPFPTVEPLRGQGFQDLGSPNLDNSSSSKSLDYDLNLEDDSD